MATFFRNRVVKEIGTDDQIVLTTDGVTRSTVIGMSLANLTESIIFVNVKVIDEDSVEGFYLKEVMIPPDTSLRALSAGEKLVLNTNNALSISSSLPDSIDLVISYVDIV
jgi:hypothetical protein